MQSSNFDFLRQPFPELHTAAVRAEHNAKTDPRAACFHARFTLEQAVNWLYDNEPYLQLPASENLGALIHEQTFRENLNPPQLFQKVRLVHKLGNQAAHNPGDIPPKTAIVVLQELHHFLYWLARYYSPNGKNLGKQPFNPNLLPETTTQTPQTLAQLQTLETELQAETERRRQAERQRLADKETYQAELQQLQTQIEALKTANKREPDSHDYSHTLDEAETRRLYIDVLLREAGQDPDAPHCREYPVTGMPKSTNPSGRGSVDYVLWDDNGLPLAVVEAKRTSKSAQAGKTQARLYADCLEAETGQRPIIFYTNGLETHIWDDRGGSQGQGYPPRPIQGFLRKDELKRLIERRHNHKPLFNCCADSDIAGRPYQQEAIRRVCNVLAANRRSALLVMATGTGKTRTAIALVDLLVRANWVKRVLFLADRTALLTQAKRAFNRHLQHATLANLSDGDDPEAKDIVLATYPTMFNRIDKTDRDGDRPFGAGYFDLVIVDEAHRSVYRKYKFLFEYFDSLLLGLTATPRSEIDRNTFEIFDLQEDEEGHYAPTFAYELGDAVDDGYLVPPRTLDVPFKFLQDGIRYDDLSDEERDEYEERLADPETGEIPDLVEAKALNRWLFNDDTTDRAIQLLMERGVKVDGGDRLGKTIVFARNHRHAEHITERFNRNYPEYGGTFAQVIDSHDSKAQSLLDDFSRADKQPIIAISVDMLDTGVDVPEVSNLVFFKPVYSRVKYNQMVGRGTRLCPDLFAPGVHKREFLIFDLYGNAEFFQQEIPQTHTKPQPSLTTRLLRERLNLSQRLPSDNPLRRQVLDELHQHVRHIDPDNVLARSHREAIDPFRSRARWDKLSPEDLETLADRLLTLPSSQPPESRLMKDFDLLCCQLQLAIAQGETETRGFMNLRDRLRSILDGLTDKANINQVREQLDRIEDAREESWWINVTPAMLEALRRHLRDLVRFVDRDRQNLVYTNFSDDVGEIEEVETPLQPTGYSLDQYKRKVMAFVRDRENHVAIAKLKRNLPLTESDLDALDSLLSSPEAMMAIESREQFETLYKPEKNLKWFIREIVGLDRQAARAAFEQYLDGSRFNANQIKFVETVIEWLTQNGAIDPGQLYEPPFSNFAADGVDGLFGEAGADELFSIVESINGSIDAYSDIA
ncbi:MAG: DEAD/DEAH box helicase family protein [Cyanobacteria bacterium SBC]|nr:DEAD/DEAH box helicase family protein [Cyanobacteria bacterium SBC]